MSEEIDRLLCSPIAKTKPGGLGVVNFVVKCHGNADAVLTIAKSTLIAALKLCEAGVFDAAVWQKELPEEFTKNSIPHPLPEEIERQMRLSFEERVAAQRCSRWSVEMFMNSFSPELEMKCWSWWNAMVIDDSHISVSVEISDWPFPWESLRWLFRGSGADDVAAEEDDE